LITVVMISLVTAAAVAAGVVWTGDIRSVGGGEAAREVSAGAAGGVIPAAWYDSRGETAKADTACDSRPNSFADLAERVTPAVVNIATSKRVSSMGQGMPFPRFGPQDPFDDFFNKFFDQVPNEQTMRSLGSGFIIDEKGTILTNNHVVSRADDIEVGISDGRKFKADILGVDEKTDIAVIRIKSKDNEKFPFAKLGNSKDIRAGDWAIAVGNPFGLEHTVTVGVISAKGRMIGGGAPFAKFIQTDASINPGNSGGPLFSTNGEVIGINTMIQANGQGIGFAIPIDMAKAMIPELVEKGSVSRGWLGVSIQEITPELAKSFKIENGKGALIAEVYEGSPAEEAGLKRGDVVIEYNGEKVEEPLDLSINVGQSKPGSDVKLVVLRGGEKKELAVKIGKQKGSETAFRPGAIDKGKSDVLGLVVRSITMDDAAELGVPATFKGIVVVRVEPESSAAMADVRTGDIVLEINDEKIQGVEDYERAASKLKKGDFVRLFVKRQNASVYLAFKL
jgi:serine protease Do